MTTTHTYALMGLSRAAYDEIAAAMREAGYDHVFGADGEIDMHGIAVTPNDEDIRAAPFDDKAAVSAGYHSPAFIQAFLGYMAAKLPQLHAIEPQRLLNVFAEFEKEMAAPTVASNQKKEPFNASQR